MLERSTSMILVDLVQHMTRTFIRTPSLREPSSMVLWQLRREQVGVFFKLLVSNLMFQCHSRSRQFNYSGQLVLARLHMLVLAGTYTMAELPNPSSSRG